MKRTFQAIHRRTYCCAIAPLCLLAQVNDKLPKELTPDERPLVKIRLLLALLGLIILFVGMFLMIWLFGRYMRRWTNPDSGQVKSSPFSEFGYHLREQIKRDQTKRASIIADKPPGETADDHEPDDTI